MCYQYAYAGLKTNIRELFARVKMFLDLEIDKQPHFLGEMIILGSLTNNMKNNDDMEQQAKFNEYNRYRSL